MALLILEPRKSALLSRTRADAMISQRRFETLAIYDSWHGRSSKLVSPSIRGDRALMRR
jgi:hypothetical protein